MERDGLYMSHGPNGSVLTVIREDGGKTLWIRNFATKDLVLDILEDDVLQDHDRTAASEHLRNKKGFYTDEFRQLEGGFSDSAFLKYVLSK